MSDHEVLSEQIHAMQSDISEIKATMRDVADALIKQARLEERHTTIAEGLGRAFAAIKSIELRVLNLERAAPVQKMTSGWVIDSMKFVLGLVIGALLIKFMGGKP